MIISQNMMYLFINFLHFFDLNISLQQDKIITIENKNASFIPLQQTLSNKVRVFTYENPSDAGIYQVKKEDEDIQNISFNFNRLESRLLYLDLYSMNDLTVNESVVQLFDDIKSENNVSELWKWFVIFAVVFLIGEMLIIKYFK